MSPAQLAITLTALRSATTAKGFDEAVRRFANQTGQTTEAVVAELATHGIYRPQSTIRDHGFEPPLRRARHLAVADYRCAVCGHPRQRHAYYA